jgi:protein-S-isoprenylcysteine O-methyltransferase Ste14
LGFEIYALWAKSGEEPFRLKEASINSICPLASPAVVQSIYPTRGLSVSAMLSLCLVIFGGVIRVSCHHRLGKMFTWETAILKTHKLVTSGPYQYVRHPAYTGISCVYIGYQSFLWTSGTFGKECFIGSDFPPTFTTRSAFGISFALILMVQSIDVMIFLTRRSFVEDRMLKKEFGKDWEEWARVVRYNVIPYVL